MHLDHWGLDLGICRRDLPNLEKGSLTCRGTNLASIPKWFTSKFQKFLVPQMCIKVWKPFQTSLRLHSVYRRIDTRPNLLDQILANPQSKINGWDHRFNDRPFSEQTLWAAPPQIIYPRCKRCKHLGEWNRTYVLLWLLIHPRLCSVQPPRA